MNYFSKRSIVLSLLLFLFVGCGSSGSKDQNTSPSTGDIPTDIQTPQNNISNDDENYQLTGFTYINQLRSSTGMELFNFRDELTTSSKNHSKYLILNNEVGHIEQNGNLGFTGETPSDRMINTLSYRPQSTGENVSAGADTITKSIDNLFSAIYHRFGFLSYNFIDIGLARESSEEYFYTSAYTYNMSSPSISQTQNSNPEIVRWPYVNQQDSMPVFFEESPDPLPDCSVSGYPISITFNPSKSGAISMESFKLFDENNIQVEDTRILDQDSDPNGLFTNREFALFPLQRLDWGKNYRAEFSYTENGGGLQNESWSFKTKDLPLPNFTVLNSGDEFTIKSGDTVYFYLPPNNCNDVLASVSLSRIGITDVTQKIFDNNTIAINAIGSGTIDVEPSNGRNFKVNVTQ